MNDLYNLLEAAAQQLADTNRCEAAWLLRGLADSIDANGSDADAAGEYRRYYQYGFDAIDAVDDSDADS